MREKRFSREQIIKAIKSHEAGTKATDICRELGIVEKTFYRWRAEYSGKVEDILLAEMIDNSKLMRLVAKALRLDPVNAFDYCTRGNNMVSYLKDYQAAIADYDKAIELDPNYVRAYYN